MRSLCRLSLRWHQQFSQSPNFAGHRKCMQAFCRGYRHVATKRPPRRQSTLQPAAEATVMRRPFVPEVDESKFLDSISRTPQSDIVVREFEQHGEHNETRRRDDTDDEITHEIAEVRAHMEKLERELAVMKEGPFGPNSKFMQSLPENEREALLKTLDEEGLLGGEEDMLTMAELERMEEEEKEEERARRRLGITLRIPKKDQAYVRHFNKALRETQEMDADVKKSLILWTWYLRCQKQIHNFSNIVSDEVWRLLWKTQADLNTRPRHLVMLAQDMLRVDQMLTSDQWMTYIESLHESGDTATAVEVWKEQKTTLKSRPELRALYWTLGVKLYAALGRPLKAQEIALNALNDGAAEPQILIPVIAAWAKDRGPDSMVKAWSCYLKLRDRLGSSIQQRVFEDISNAFLALDCADMALNVFKDMLLSREQSKHDSQAVYRQATKHFDEVMQNATTEEQINRVGLSALLILPRSFQNRYFFTSWIKKLIGEGRIDAAAMVVELMYERGIAPDAKPLNGIIGAWLREGSPSSQEKAEKMAWVMIDARADLVSNKLRLMPGENFRRVQTQGDYGHMRRAVFLRKRIPPASIETFSIMLLHFTRRSDFEKAEELTRQMTGPCQLKPNSFIMNHWLYADLRASKIQDVWHKYKDLSHEIAPDLETFAALWDTAKAQYSKANPAHAKDFPTPRQLFAEMMTWTNTLTKDRLKRARADFSSELYAQIIRCFCIIGDLSGALAAMHGLERQFNVIPEDDSVRLICGAAARVLSQVTAKAEGKSRNTRRHKSLLGQVGEVIDAIDYRRRNELFEQYKYQLQQHQQHKNEDQIQEQNQGQDQDQDLEKQLIMNLSEISDPTSRLSQTIKLPIMTEFICAFLLQKQDMLSISGNDSYKNDIKVAAKAMHVDLDGVNLDISSSSTDDQEN